MPVEGGARVAIVGRRPPDERGRAGGPAQDARGAAIRRHARPVCRCGGAAPADDPIAMRAAPAGPGRTPRGRSHPRRARRRRIRRWPRAWRGSAVVDQVTPSPGPRTRTPSASGMRSPDPARPHDGASVRAIGGRPLPPRPPRSGSPASSSAGRTGTRTLRSTPMPDRRRPRPILPRRQPRYGRRPPSAGARRTSSSRSGRTSRATCCSATSGHAASLRDYRLLEETVATAEALDASALVAFLDRLGRAGVLLGGNVSPELVLDDLALAWPHGGPTRRDGQVDGWMPSSADASRASGIGSSCSASRAVSGSTAGSRTSRTDRSGSRAEGPGGRPRRTARRPAGRTGRGAHGRCLDGPMGRGHRRTSVRSRCGAGGIRRLTDRSDVECRIVGVIPSAARKGDRWAIPTGTIVPDSGARWRPTLRPRSSRPVPRHPRSGRRTRGRGGPQRSRPHPHRRDPRVFARLGRSRAP